MSIRSRLEHAARSGAARLSGALAAFSQAPVIPGIGRAFGGAMRLPHDARAQALVDSRDALFGRVTAQLGPVPSYISTNPNAGLTPKRIADIQRAVLVAGYMVDWACLIEDVFLSDSEIRAVDESGREGITGAPFTVEPADGSDEARWVADYQQATIDQISGWDRSMERLLCGNAAGYALEDVAYDERAIVFPVGDSRVTVEAFTPTALEFVHQKHTRWDLSVERLELDTGGQFIRPPQRKFITYEAPGDFAVRRRGYMYPAIWLHMLKANAWARWGVLLEVWGLRQPYGVATLEQWQNQKRREEMLAALRKFGQGGAALFTDDFRIVPSEGISDGDSRGMHAALISAVNLELSKLILGSTLTTEISGTGSYNAAETHADTKQARLLKWERNLSNCVREWMRAALRLACYRIAPDGTELGVNPRGLSAALKLPPERVVALCGRPSWRVQREVTPQVRMQLYDAGVNKLGLDIDEDTAMRDLGFKRARSPGKRLRGAPVTLPANGAATSTTEALEGAQSPSTDQAAA